MSGEPSKNSTEPDDANVGLIATVTLVGAFLILSIALALNALVKSESRAHGQEVGSSANLGSVKRLKAEQEAKLASSPAWMDPSKGLVSIPIDRAEGVVLAELAKDPHRATPAPPPPPPAPEPAPSTEASAVPAAPAPEKK